MRDFEANSVALELGNTQLKAQLHNANVTINNLEQYSQRNSLRITNNWGEEPSENTNDRVSALVKEQHGVELNSHNIDRSHHVGPATGTKQ